MLSSLSPGGSYLNASFIFGESDEVLIDIFAPITPIFPL
jgi:hypothetical protein